MLLESLKNMSYDTAALSITFYIEMPCLSLVYALQLAEGEAQALVWAEEFILKTRQCPDRAPDLITSDSGD